MLVEYIFHSGFLLETADCYYLFDYYQGELPLLKVQKPIVVFSSHAHKDHYQPDIFVQLRARGMRDVLAVLSKDIPEKRYPPDTEVLKVYAGQSYSLPLGERLETLQSTDCGVAFVLTTGEDTVYHAGDLNDWCWSGADAQENRQMRGNYRHEIDRLRGVAIDDAFVVLDPRQEEHFADGMLYLLQTLSVKRVYPMHYWRQPEIITQFLRRYPQYQGIIQQTETIREVTNHEMQNDSPEL